MRNKMKTLAKINILIIIVSTIICFYYSMFYFKEKDTFMAVGSILMILLPLSIYVLEWIVKKEINEAIKLGFLLFVLASGVFGAIGGIYNKISYYDKLIHFISGIMVSLIFIISYKHFYKGEPNKKTFLLAFVIFNAAVAAFWEIFEFSFDILFDKSVQKGNADTMMDMITAIIGGVLTSFFYIKMRISKAN